MPPRSLRAVRETWPDYRDHMAWVRLGSAEWPGDTYGAHRKPKSGDHDAGVPACTDEELAQVVLYERSAFGGLEEGDEEYEQLVAIAEGETDLRGGRARPGGHGGWRRPVGHRPWMMRSPGRGPGTLVG